jgi:hypothetical protein
MMIIEFAWPEQADEVAAAEASPEPKHVWYDGARVVIYTGEDIPSDGEAI